MAMLLRTSVFRASPPYLSTVPSSSTPVSPLSVNFRYSSKPQGRRLYAQSFFPNLSRKPRVSNYVSFASPGEATETEKQQESEVQEVTEGDVVEEAGEAETGDNDKADTVESPTSAIVTAIVTSLQLYKEALRNNDEAKIAEIEAFFKAIEDEKNDLEKKVVSLSEEMAVQRERILRISADFDNFRKRSERDRLTLVSNAQGEVVENFLSVLDNFERAKIQIKVETEGEEKINNSYQSINKQFLEILAAAGVVPVETVGNSFDPLLHEAIMQEESTEYDEGIIIEEYRKGFKLGDRLLRPAMVKVSAGPGPGTTETPEPSAEPKSADESSKAEEEQ